MLAEAAAFLRSANVPPPGSMAFIDEDAWLDELERRLAAMPESRGRSLPPSTERTQFGGRPVDPGPALVAGR